MSYSEYTWQTGETITAEKLNNLEGGVQEALDCCGGGGITFTCTIEQIQPSTECSTGGTKYTYSHSWQELRDAIQQGKTVSVPGSHFEQGVEAYVYDFIVSVTLTDGEYQALTFVDSKEIVFDNATSKVHIDGCTR